MPKTLINPMDLTVVLKSKFSLSFTSAVALQGETDITDDVFANTVNCGYR